MRKLLFALLTVAACADADPSRPDDDVIDPEVDEEPTAEPVGGVSEADRRQDYDDAAASLGANLVAGELAAMVDSINLSYGRRPAGFDLSAREGHTFGKVVREGIVTHYTLNCRDRNNALVTCNGRQSHANVDVDYSGIVPDIAMGGIERSASWVVSDTMTPTPSIAGGGHSTFATTYVTGDYVITFKDAAERVQFTSTLARLPVSGAIGMKANVERSRPTATPSRRQFTVDVTIQFRDDDFAQLTLDGTERFEVTLVNGAVTRL